MDPSDRLIVDLSNEELEELGFIGPDAPEEVRRMIESIQKPNLKPYLGWMTVFQIECVKSRATSRPSAPSPTALPQSFDTTAVDPDSASDFEKAFFYKGISEDPPHLLQRSDVRTRPFVIPPLEDQHTAIPDKTVNGAFDPILTPDLWRNKVCPAIVGLLKEKERNIHVSTIMPVRFSTSDAEGKPVLDKHIVIWISVFPGTTTEESCRDANSPILAILEEHQVREAAVHWIEGAPERLNGPSMMQVFGDTDPTALIRRALTTVMGVPIALRALRHNDGQGTLGIFFHEGTDKKGDKSDRVLAFTCKHVVSGNTATDYELGGFGARKQWIGNCGRFEKLKDETIAVIAKKVGQGKLVAEQLAEDAFTSQGGKERKETELKNLEEDIAILSDFSNLLKSTWSEGFKRVIGWLQWAPKIQNDVDHRCYTWDGAVFQLDKAKWAKEFRGNYVYLGGKFDSDDITKFFYPNTANPHSFDYPSNHLFRIQGCVDAQGIKKPYFLDDEGNPCFIVAKVGQTTDLTFGRFSDCEAYVARDLGGSSWEVAIFNFAKEDFSAKGDSGSCIFNAEGKMVAFLHSGMPRGHVTFGTPAHFVLDQIKTRYPYADFNRTTFSDVPA